MKLRKLIYLLVFLCSFVPMCIWIAFSAYDTKQKLEMVVSDNIEAIAGSQVFAIENFCEGRKETMETITKYQVVQDAILNERTEDEELNRLLVQNKENKSFIASISVVDIHFHVIGSSENYTPGGISDFKYSDEKYHSGEFALGNIHERETDDGLKRVVPAYIGIFRDGELIGYLIEEIESSYFDQFRLQTDFLEDGTLYIIDGVGGLVTAGTSATKESLHETITTEADRQNYEDAWNDFDHEKYDAGIIRYKFHGQNYLTYFSSIKYTDWGLRITENISAQLYSGESVYFMLILEGLLVATALLLVQLLITRRVIVPFDRIMNTFKTIQKNHDYSLRTNVRTKDEVGDVAKGVDALLDYIEQEELEEKRKQREFAEEAMHRAQASDRAKSIFLYNASHDIRTPMNAIQGFAHIIEQNPEDVELVKDSVKKIQKSGNTLMTLLNNVLELSKIESGKDENTWTVVDFHELMDELHMMFEQDVKEAGIVFLEECSIADYVVLTDEVKCRRIMMNLLSNARKFTQQGGTIVYGVKQMTESKDGWAQYCMYVKDSGIGMSDEFRERAFEQFEMENTTTISGVTGNGLGLAIVKRLAEQMQGECMIESERGKGTEISVIVRLQIAEPVEKQKPEAEVIAPMDFAGKRVLMVEDNEMNREIARYILEDAGMIVEEAENGQIAVDRMMQPGAGEDFDFILMDIQMPVMDGYAATKVIRQITNQKVSTMPIIAMTANAFVEDRVKCLEAGMNEHIKKPIDMEVVFKVLQEVLMNNTDSTTK